MKQIAIMESEHSDLDAVIERLGEDLPFDQLKLQRLKKRKLILKDEMAKLRSRILPDIIANKDIFNNLNKAYCCSDSSPGPFKSGGLSTSST